MKKYLFSVMFAFALMIPLFSQSKADSVPETKTESTELNISFLDEKLLVNMPNYFSDGAYQNPAGKKFSFKESTQMLLEFPESASFVSQYKGWRAATFALLGICCAGIAADLVCTFNENLPNRQAIYTAASLTSLLSLSGSLFTSSVAGHKYRVAMDCYNLNILGLK